MMARKPAHIVAASPKPTGRDAVWAAIRKWSGSFTVQDINRETDIARAAIRDYVASLEAAGFVTKEDHSKVPFAPYSWRLVKDPGAEAPRVREDGSAVTQGLGTQAMWRTMKVLGSFTPEELALAASTATVPIKENTASDYLKFMLRAGYVRLNSGRYSFVKSRDPGPLPPQIQRIKQVFDPNSRTVVWPAGKGGDA